MTKDRTQKRQKRRRLSHYLPVYEQSSDRLVGRIVDITTNGIRLFCENPIEPDTRMRLRMDLPKSAKRKGDIRFEACGVWCREGMNPDFPGFYDTGFRMVDASAAEIEAIEHLIKAAARPS